MGLVTSTPSTTGAAAGLGAAGAGAGAAAAGAAAGAAAAGAGAPMAMGAACTTCSVAVEDWRECRVEFAHAADFFKLRRQASWAVTTANGYGTGSAYYDSLQYILYTRQDLQSLTVGRGTSRTKIHSLGCCMFEMTK